MHEFYFFDKSRKSYYLLSPNLVNLPIVSNSWFLTWHILTHLHIRLSLLERLSMGNENFFIEIIWQNIFIEKKFYLINYLTKYFFSISACTVLDYRRNQNSEENFVKSLSSLQMKLVTLLICSKLPPNLIYNKMLNIGLILNFNMNLALVIFLWAE